MTGDTYTIRLVLMGRLLLSPPPRDALLAEVYDCLDQYPNGLAESIVEIDGQKIFFIMGPREGNAIRVDVWDHYEAEAMFKNAGRPFFKGRAP